MSDPATGPSETAAHADDQLQRNKRNRSSHQGDHSDAKRTPLFVSITSKLSSTFAVMAALTAIACAIAWIVFSQIKDSVSLITEQSLPEISVALKIAETSASIAAIAPAFVASESQDELSIQRSRLAEANTELKALISTWDSLETESILSEQLSDAAVVIEMLIANIDAAKRNQLELAADIRQRIKELSELHSQFLESLEPLIDDTVFDLVIDSEMGLAETSQSLATEIETGVERLRSLLQLRTEIHEAISLAREAAALPSERRFNSILDAYQEPKKQVETILLALRETEDAELIGSVETILRRTDQTFPPNGSEVQTSTIQNQFRTGLNDAQRAFIGIIDPAIETARQTLITSGKELTDQQGQDISELVDVGANTLVNLLTLRAEGNLAAGLLNEAANVIDDFTLGPLAERFFAASGQMERALGQLPDEIGSSEIADLVGRFSALGSETDTVFVLKQREIDELDTARFALDESRSRAEAMGEVVDELVFAAESTSANAVSRAEEIISNSQIIMLLISAASLFGAVFIMLAYVKPRLVRPIEDITSAMGKLAGGDTSVEIPGRERNDELGHMAKALAVFRDITIEVQESNLREIETARRRLTDAIESISEAFSLYDSDDRLVVCNQKYGTLVHPEIAEQIQPGLRFEEILRLALREGYIEEAVGREDEWLKQRLQRHRNPGAPHLLERTDGFWIMVSERKTADGGTVAVYSDITELKERENELAEKSQALEQLSSQLSKYLSPQIYQSIFTGEQSAVVASKRKKLTIFFSDLAGFTETADRLESEDLTQLINEYLTEMSEIALAHGATIDKYIGDAVMIFFGDPVSLGVKQDALACARMAIAMQARLRELSIAWSNAGLVQHLQCRIGIATGYSTVGNFGSEDRMDYTIIGGSVNLASRLESAAHPGTILISEETFNLIGDEIACEPKDTVKVKGIAYPVKTFQIVGTREDALKQGRISENVGRLSLEADLAAMSEEERSQAAELLRDVLGQLDKDTKG